MADGGTAVKEKAATGGAPATAAGGDALKVFLSYSRVDSDFAEDLLVALKTCGFAPYLDKHDIAPGEPWEDRLQRLILAADTVVYVISPDSIKSERCRWEVEKTESLNKRILPVVWRKVDETAVPERLKRLNYTFFSGTGESFAKGLASLAMALNTDLDWIREYTRLGDLAQAWHSRGQPINRLLTGTDIGDAKDWMERHPSGAPEPSALQREFIAESDRAETARASQERQRLRAMARIQRRVWYILGFSALVLIALFVSSAWGLRELAKREVQTFETLADDAFDKGQYDLALRYGLAGLPGHGASPIAYWSRRLEDEIRHSAMANRLRAVLGGHKFVPAVRWTEDGTRLMTWSYNDSAARLWDVANRKLIKELPIKEPTGETPTEAAIDNMWVRGDRLLMTSRDATVAPRLWNVHTGEPIGQELAGVTGPIEMPLSRTSPFAVAGTSRFITWKSSEGIARLWDSETGMEIATYGDATNKVVGFALFETVERLVTWGERAGSERLWNLTTGGAVGEFREAGRVTGVRLVSGSQLLTYDQGYRTLQLWDATTGNRIAMLGPRAGSNRLVESEPDGDRIVTWSFGGDGAVWNAVNGQLVKELSVHQIRQVKLYGKGRHLLTAAQGDHTARLWDARTGDLVKEMTGPGQEAPVTRIELNEARTRATTWTENGRSIRLWDAETGEFVAELGGHDASVVRAPFSPDGNSIMTIGENERSSRLWNAATGKFISELGVHDGKIRQFGWTKDGTKVLTTADNDDAVRLWNATSGTPIDIIRARSPVTNFYLLPDGNTIATTGPSDRELKLWDVGTGALAESLRLPFPVLPTDRKYTTDDRVVIAAMSNHSLSDQSKIAFLSYPSLAVVKVQQADESPLADVVLSRKAARLVTWTRFAKPARLWDIQTGEKIADLGGHTRAITGASMSRDGGRVVTRASGDPKARLWDSNTGKFIAELSGHAGQVAGISQSANGDRILTYAENDTVARLWDGLTGQLIKELKGHTGAVESGTINEDGTRAITRTATGTSAWLWDARTGDLVSELTGHDAKIEGFVFSRDGTRLETREGTVVRLWDAKDGKLIKLLSNENERVVAVALGSRAIGTRSAKTARLWDPKTGALISELNSESGSVYAWFFSEFAPWLATWSREGSVARLWDAHTGSPIVDLETRGAIQGLSENADGSLIASWAKQGTVAEIWSSADGGSIAALANRADSRVELVFFGKEKDNRQVFVLGESALSRWDLRRASTKSGEELRDLVCSDLEVDDSVRIFADQEMRKISRAELRDPCNNYGVFSREFHKRMMSKVWGYARSKFVGSD